MEAFFAEMDASDFVRDYVDVDRFLECCKVCPNYGAKWSCPPFAFDVQAFWAGCERIGLYAWKVDTADLAGRTDAAAQAEAAHRRAELRRQMQAELYAQEAARPGTKALVCGSCDLCEGCARKQGRDCIQPQKMRHSIESLGGNVGKVTEKLFGLPLQWSKNGEITKYTVLVSAICVLHHGEKI